MDFQVGDFVRYRGDTRNRIFEVVEDSWKDGTPIWLRQIRIMDCGAPDHVYSVYPSSVIKISPLERLAREAK
jgi:hypothetical protein